MKIACLVSVPAQDEEIVGQTQTRAHIVLARPTVAAVAYSVGRDMLTFTYEDGREVTITLHQCKTHSCDDTCMVVEG